MSAKKSWDIPRAKGSASARPRARKSAPVRRSAPTRSAKRESLGARRKRARGIALVFSLVLLIAACGLLIYGLWRPEVRIGAVHAEGTAAESISMLVLETLEGTYGHIIPRDSTFFFPVKEARAALLSAHPEFSTVSIRRDGFDALSVRTTARVSALLWCGEPTFTPSDADTCYEADASGLVFARRASFVTGGPAMTRLYSSLMEPREATTLPYPLARQVGNLDVVPAVLAFVKDLGKYGIATEVIAIREDEADLFLPSGTRLTYVIGREEEAAMLAAATLPTLDLSDGSIEYVDLRFAGKVYVKRRGE